MIKKDGEVKQEIGRKKKKKVKSKGVERKEEIQLKLKNVIETEPSESEIKGSNGGPGPQIAKSVKRKKGGGEAALLGPSKKKKMHHGHNNGKVSGQHSNRGHKRKSSYPKNPEINFGSHLAARYRRPPTNSKSYAYTGASEPPLRHSDLEPHAGYLPSAIQVSTTYEYGQRRSGAYNSEQRRISWISRATQGLQTSYPEYTGYADYQSVGYRYPRTGAYAPRGTYY